jgi:hypothetical protein
MRFLLCRTDAPATPLPCDAVELSPIVTATPQGLEPVTVENLQADGGRWGRALASFFK